MELNNHIQSREILVRKGWLVVHLQIISFPNRLAADVQGCIMPRFKAPPFVNVLLMLYGHMENLFYFLNGNLAKIAMLVVCHMYISNKLYQILFCFSKHFSLYIQQMVISRSYQSQKNHKLDQDSWWNDLIKNTRLMTISAHYLHNFLMLNQKKNISQSRVLNTGPYLSTIRTGIYHWYARAYR